MYLGVGVACVILNEQSASEREWSAFRYSVLVKMVDHLTTNTYLSTAARQGHRNCGVNRTVLLPLLIRRRSQTWRIALSRPARYHRDSRLLDQFNRRYSITPLHRMRARNCVILSRYTSKYLVMTLSIIPRRILEKDERVACALDFNFILTRCTRDLVLLGSFVKVLSFEDAS